jgi:hypothetical protein
LAGAANVLSSKLKWNRFNTSPELDIGPLVGMVAVTFSAYSTLQLMTPEEAYRLIGFSLCHA